MFLKCHLTLPILLLVLTAACDGTDGSDAGEHQHDDGGEHEHEHEHDDGGHDEPDGGDAAADSIAYCNCVFLACHDDYHTKWGEDELMSRAACLEEADALPRLGEDSTSGENLECRQHFCDEMPVDCVAALGGDPCTT